MGGGGVGGGGREEWCFLVTQSLSIRQSVSSTRDLLSRS